MSEEYLQVTVDKFIFRVKTGYLYSVAGVWVAYDENSALARLGLTDFRQQASGDMAFVNLPEIGSAVEAGQELASLETVKVDMSVPAPFAGTIGAVNVALSQAPELINQSPYGEGWLVELKPYAWPAEGMLDAEAYLAVMARQATEESAG